MDDAMAGLIAVLIGLGLVGVMLLPVWIIRRRQGRKVFEPVYKDIERLKAERRPALDRAAARLSGVPTCPRCGSTAVTGNRNGYNAVRGIFWALALGVGGWWVFHEYWDRAVVSFYHVFGDEVYRFLRPISSTTAAAFFATLGALTGLRIGSTGSQRVTVTCLNCGCRYDPAVRHFFDNLR